MTTDIIIWTVLAFPLILGLLFRVGAPHLFFAMMAGELLGRYFGHDVEKQANDLLTTQPPEKYGEILLIIVPMVLTAFFLRKSISKSKLLIHIIPLAITGIILAAFIFPLLPADTQNQISNNLVGGWIINLNRSIIGVVVVVQLVSLWLFNRSEKKSKHE